jgi:hypothetical protein
MITNAMVTTRQAADLLVADGPGTGAPAKSLRRAEAAWAPTAPRAGSRRPAIVLAVGYQAEHQACTITTGDHTRVERSNLLIAMQNLHTDCDPLLWTTCGARTLARGDEAPAPVAAAAEP